MSCSGQNGEVGSSQPARLPNPFLVVSISCLVGMLAGRTRSAGAGPAVVVDGHQLHVGGLDGSLRRDAERLAARADTHGVGRNQPIVIARFAGPAPACALAGLELVEGEAVGADVDLTRMPLQPVDTSIVSASSGWSVPQTQW